jgi:hypothetical protein
LREGAVPGLRDKTYYDIVRVIHEEHARVRKEVQFGDARVRESLKQTGWMFTYLGCDDPKHVARENTFLRLGIYHPDVSEKQRGIIPTGKAAVLMPSGTTQEQFEDMSAAANEGLRTGEDLSDFQQNLQYHIQFVAALIRTVSEWNQTVSPTFQVGVHSWTYGSGISNIAGDGRPLSLVVGRESG